MTAQEQTANLKVVTTGVYGFSEEAFFQALQDANVDTFVDIRQRRGLRGATYAFANSKRLQARLAELGINYLHYKDLAPTKEVRQRQNEADKVSRTAKRQRTDLSRAFVAAYREEILDDFDPQTLLEALPPEARVITLFCVEREPEACHRSLVAQKLHNELNLDVEHITP